MKFIGDMMLIMLVIIAVLGLAWLLEPVLTFLLSPLP